MKNGVERTRGPECLPQKCKKHNGECHLVQKHIQSFYSTQEYIKVIIECLQTLTPFENMYMNQPHPLCVDRRK